MIGCDVIWVIAVSYLPVLCDLLTLLIANF